MRSLALLTLLLPLAGCGVPVYVGDTQVLTPTGVAPDGPLAGAGGEGGASGGGLFDFGGTGGVPIYVGDTLISNVGGPAATPCTDVQARAADASLSAEQRQAAAAYAASLGC